MKKLPILMLLVVFLVSCNLPFLGGAETPIAAATSTVEFPSLPSPAATEPPTTAVPTGTPVEGMEINLNGIYMVIPTCLANGLTAQIVPANPSDPNGGPMSVYPEHRQVNFTGYPLGGKFWEPTLRVYPMQEFADMWAFSAEQATALQNLINSQQMEVTDSLPFLPNLGAAQVFHAGLKYLTFVNGSGARYLTEYAQYYAPVNNTDLFYTFQGLTSDGKYWISAVFPVNLPYLQDAWDSTDVPAGGVPAPSMDSPTYSEDMTAYYVTMLNRLNSTPNEDFTPTLSCIDQFISSINVME